MGGGGRRSECECVCECERECECEVCVSVCLPAIYTLGVLYFFSRKTPPFQRPSSDGHTAPI